MENITLIPPKSLSRWIKLYLLYRRSFPRAERKPFPAILKKYRQGSTYIWCICRDDRFLGFASTMNSPDLIMLDYLVISPNCPINCTVLNQFTIYNCFVSSGDRVYF